MPIERFDMDAIIAARKAPAGQFRVMAVDTWSPPGTDYWGVGDYATMAEAAQVADARAAQAAASKTDPYTKFYVYDDRGEFRHQGQGPA